MTMKMKDAISIVRNECYVFNPMDFDKTYLINSALDQVLDFVERKADGMTFDELKAEANMQGYKLVKKGRPRPITATYNQCRDCKYLCGELSCVGIECTNPDKRFRTRTAKYKSKSQKACKLFEKNVDE